MITELPDVNAASNEIMNIVNSTGFPELSFIVNQFLVIMFGFYSKKNMMIQPDLDETVEVIDID